ncbi:response regulator [uncultured Ferrimonas sp.]|uniref:response regulator n=1 Tax=uncultured Ferrimonas sp. TaxID=432640 RepID=UPI0026134372|nr:response regulator [uncultured Ferrimonas sp.]
MTINWERRAQRERLARIAAEQMLEQRSEQLYEANQALTRINSNQSNILEDQSQQLDRRRQYESLLNQSFGLLLDASLVVPKRVLGQLITLLEQEQHQFKVWVGWQGQWQSGDIEDFVPMWRNYAWQELTKSDQEVIKANGHMGLWCQSADHQIALLLISDAVSFDDSDSWFVRSLMASLEAYAVNVRAYSKLQAAQQQTAHMAQVRYRFLASVTHELRTPLNGMLASTDLLMESELTPEQQELLTIVSLSGQSLLALVNDVLDYAKIEDGGFALNPQPHDLQQLIQEALEVVRSAAQEQGNQLKLDWFSESPCVVAVDPLRLKQVLLNLLSNAVKFTKMGQVTLKVSALAANEHCDIQFAVIDDGCGIDGATISKIFQPFAQAAGAEHRGTGLGLAICNHLCQVMGSKLEVVSEPGHGSTFSFRLMLPFAQIEQQQPQELALSLTEQQLLVVDDTRANQLVAKLMLEKVGANIDLASNGKEALERVQQKRYDLILMDCRMPLMDGFECTKTLREQGCLTPIIALTATTTEEDLARCFEVGMNDVLYKPIQKNVMVAKIQQWINDEAEMVT